MLGYLRLSAQDPGSGFEALGTKRDGGRGCRVWVYVISSSGLPVRGLLGLNSNEEQARAPHAILNSTVVSGCSLPFVAAAQKSPGQKRAQAQAQRGPRVEKRCVLELPIRGVLQMAP